MFFFLVMLNIIPDRVKTVSLQVSFEQVHERAFARSPLPGNGKGQGWGCLGITHKAGNALGNRLKGERVWVAGFERAV